MTAKAKGDVSLVTPISATTPAAVIFTAAWLLDEHISTIGWIGILVLVFGTYTLNLQALRDEQGKQLVEHGFLQRQLLLYSAPFRKLTSSTAVRWAFLAACLASFSMVFDGMVARRTNIGFGFGLVFGIAALGNLPIAIVRKEYRGVSWSEVWRRIILLGMLGALTDYFTSFAFRLSDVAYVGTMKRLQIPLTIILAYLCLGEKARFRDRLAGGILMAIGATIISQSR